MFTSVFSFCICLWCCHILTLSDLRQPAWRLPGLYSLRLFPSVVNLITLHSAVRVKPHREWQNPFCCWGHCFPSSSCPLDWSGCLRRMVAALGVMTQHRDPSDPTLSSLPKASVPSLSPSISSPLCSPFSSYLLSVAVSLSY